MKKRLTSALMLITATTLYGAPDAETLAEQKCTPCHLVLEITPERLKEMSAPPMWGVVKKVKSHYPTKEEAIAFVIDYTMNPAREKMLFPDSTAERFGIMPSQKENLTAKELRAIAEYIYQ